MGSVEYYYITYMFNLFFHETLNLQCADFHNPLRSAFLKFWGSDIFPFQL